MLQVLDEGALRVHEQMAMYVLQGLEARRMEVPREHWFARWMGDYLSTYAPFADAIAGQEMTGLRERMLELDPSVGNTLALFDAVFRHLPDLCADAHAIERLLMGPAYMELWQDYFSAENRSYQTNNLWMASMLSRVLRPGSRILEVGGGLGSAARTLAAMLGDSSLRDGHLHFTDISPFLLRKARSRLGSYPCEISFSIFDLNDKPPFTPGSFDVIYGVNTLHVVRFMEQTLLHLRTLLKPGGTFLLLESVRPDLKTPIYPELVFGFFPDFHKAHLTSNRPKGGFLDAPTWMRLIQVAGFESVRSFYADLCALDDYPFIYCCGFSAVNPC